VGQAGWVYYHMGAHLAVVVLSANASGSAAVLCCAVLSRLVVVSVESCRLTAGAAAAARVEFHRRTPCRAASSVQDVADRRLAAGRADAPSGARHDPQCTRATNNIHQLGELIGKGTSLRGTSPQYLSGRCSEVTQRQCRNTLNS